MSSSANLYAVDDSDRDSFSDELTPTDGYFNRSQRMSSNEMVQDHSVEDSKPEPKTLIAPPHLGSTGGGPSRSSLNSVFPQSSPSSRRALSPPQIDTSPSPVTYNTPSPVNSSPTETLYSEQSPLVNGPPPAYSPTPAPTAVPQQAVEHRYSTFPQEERGFLPPRAPQSMGGPVDDLDDRSPSAEQPWSPLGKLIKKFRTRISKVVLVLLVFVAAFSILMRFATTRYSNPGSPGNIPIEDSPVRDRPVDAEGPYCPAARLRDAQVTYEFSTGTELTVIQTTHNTEHWWNTRVSTVGEIRLRKIPKDSKHGNKPHFTIDAHVSDPELEVVNTWDAGSKTLKISTPYSARLSGIGRHCISLEITAWFPEDSKLTNLVVEAVSLDLRVIDDIKVDVNDRSRFTTVSGDVRFPTVSDESFYMMQPQVSGEDTETSIDSVYEGPVSPFSSRNIIVETVSGSIKGAYPLRDLLGISSQSGSVDVKLIPSPADDSAPAPADLEIQTSSGSIKAYVPISNSAHPGYMPPARNYITRVHSNSGSISGSFYLGSESNFKSNSGSITIDTLPMLQSGASDPKGIPKNVFETHTLSGATAIDIQDPIFISQRAVPDVGGSDPYRLIPVIDDQPLFTIDYRTSLDKLKLHSLKSVHSTTSANVEVHYPDAWEGTFHGKVVSGRITLSGDGIRILKHRKGPGYTEILAQRGVEEKKDGSTVEMNSVSGSLAFSVGEVV